MDRASVSYVASSAMFVLAIGVSPAQAASSSVVQNLRLPVERNAHSTIRSEGSGVFVWVDPKDTVPTDFGYLTVEDLEMMERAANAASDSFDYSLIFEDD